MAVAMFNFLLVLEFSLILMLLKLCLNHNLAEHLVLSCLHHISLYQVLFLLNVRNSYGFLKSCLFVDLTVALCRILTWSRVWCFLPQTSIRHFIEQIQSFNKWIFKIQFFNYFSLAAKSVLPLTSFVLSWDNALVGVSNILWR